MGVSPVTAKSSDLPDRGFDLVAQFLVVAFGALAGSTFM